MQALETGWHRAIDSTSSTRPRTTTGSWALAVVDSAQRDTIDPSIARRTSVTAHRIT